MRASIPLASLIVAGCFFTAACTQRQDPDQLRRETAQATQTMKQDAQAVAEGVREGLKSNKPLDLNDASRSELTGLPGINGERADSIIAGRPFTSTSELVRRHIVSEAEYDRIRDHIQVGKPSPSIK